MNVGKFSEVYFSSDYNYDLMIVIYVARVYSNQDLKVEFTNEGKFAKK